MIRYYHGSPGNMFDPNSYQRGAATLGMLREYVGDEAFFATLKYYLETHAYQPVEIHDLRMAFEHITGEDLNWFFDQWFLTAGFPRVDMKVAKDSTGGQHVLQISQEHAYDEKFTYRLPIPVHLYQEGQKTEQRIWLTTADSTYIFPAEVDLLIPDPAQMLVGEVTKTYPRHFYKAILQHDTRLRERSTALDTVAQYQEGDGEAYRLLKAALQDPYHGIRAKSLRLWEPHEEDAVIVREMALTDGHPKVRAAAVNKVFSVGNSDYYDVFYTAINDSSMRVASQALYLIYETAPSRAMQYATQFEAQVPLGDAMQFAAERGDD
jgi:aminopeptidase N